ncbi:MAG: translesion DNA synthesis-associated protein ImuA, partial [Betaproteobacteria bacterium]|nr:translesion DNA synthesis-associated protein ImuA [Betaproteobacteria bacterium]
MFRVGDLHSRADAAWPSGFAALDRELPGGGWPRAGLVDIARDGWGIGELSLVLPGVAASLQTREARGLWVLPPRNGREIPWIPYAPSLIAHGIALDQLAFVRPPTTEEGLWCAEQALRSGAVTHVLLWLDEQRLASLALKRLQQAAMAGGACVFAFHALASLASPSPALLRLALHAAPLGALRIDLVKRRGLPDGRSIIITPRHIASLQRDASAQVQRTAWAT